MLNTDTYRYRYWVVLSYTGTGAIRTLSPSSVPEDRPSAEATPARASGRVGIATDRRAAVAAARAEAATGDIVLVVLPASGRDQHRTQHP